MELKYFPRPWPWGKPADFWLNNVITIRDMIKKFKLRPVADEFLIPEGALIAAKPTKVTAKTATWEWGDLPPWIWKYGGRRIAHLHYGNKVYVLNEKQWAYFSGRVIKGFQKRLETVRNVGFEQIMTLSSSMEEIAPGEF